MWFAKKTREGILVQKQQQTLAMHLELFTSDQNRPNHIHETLVHKLRNLMKELRRNFPAFSSSITQQLLKKPKDCLMACDIVAWLETDTETQRQRELFTHCSGNRCAGSNVEQDGLSVHSDGRDLCSPSIELQQRAVYSHLCWFSWTRQSTADLSAC
jgi:hypothetical protein